MTTTNEKVIKRTKGKKVDVKAAAKRDLSKLFADFLVAQGIDVSTNAEDFAFTAGTLVVHMENTDVQVKLITPKAGLERYQQVVFVDEEEYEEIVDAQTDIIDEIELTELIEEIEIEDAMLEAELVG